MDRKKMIKNKSRLLEKRDKEWMNRPEKEREIDGIVYECPAKKIDGRIMQLADIFLISEWSDLETLIDDLKDRYENKKETLGIYYRLIKKKEYVEVWRTY